MGKDKSGRHHTDVAPVLFDDGIVAIILFGFDGALMNSSSCSVDFAFSL